MRSGVLTLLSLDGMSYEDYLHPLKDDLVIIGKEDYDPEDIEPYLSKLKKKKGISNNSIEGIFSAAKAVPKTACFECYAYPE